MNSFSGPPPSQHEWPCDKILAAGSKYRSGSLLIKSQRWGWLCLSCLLPDLNADVTPVAAAVPWKTMGQKAWRQKSENTENGNRTTERERAPGPRVPLLSSALVPMRVYLQTSGHTKHVSTHFWKPLLLGYWYLCRETSLVTFKGCFIKLTGSGDKNSGHSRMTGFCYNAWGLHWGDGKA